jgi:hypothetical protein
MSVGDAKKACPRRVPGKERILSRGRRTYKALNLLCKLVGARGFEPPTPSPPDWCANQAALRSDFGPPYVRQ